MKQIKHKKIKLLLITIVLISFAGFMFYQFYGGGCCKSKCSAFESDAFNVAAAIINFYSDPKNNGDPTYEDISEIVATSAPYIFSICNDEFVIHVFDAKGNCEKEYQEAIPEWNNNVYTKRFKIEKRKSEFHN